MTKLFYCAYLISYFFHNSLSIYTKEAFLSDFLEVLTTSKFLVKSCKLKKCFLSITIIVIYLVLNLKSHYIVSLVSKRLYV